MFASLVISTKSLISCNCIVFCVFLFLQRCAVDVDRTSAWHPCGMYAPQYWVTSYFAQPVVATSVIIYLGSDGMHRNLSAVERLSGQFRVTSGRFMSLPVVSCHFRSFSVTSGRFLFATSIQTKQLQNLVVFARRLLACGVRACSVELLGVDNSSHPAGSMDVRVACRNNPIHINLVHDLSTPFFYSRGETAD